ncbi:MAG: A/G-specific adenine glycosylase, partial [Propionicimonas sp.]
AAGAIVRDHAGEVPADPAALRELPGVGEYTAAAIAAFAYGRRVVVLDTNVRRVLARVEGGQAVVPATLTTAERDRAAAWLPVEPAAAARWSVAVMELGAVVCTAAGPACGSCPVAADCHWLAAGRPAPARPGRVQGYAGTDRQARGVLLDLLRRTPAAVDRQVLIGAWPVDPGQAERALDSLVADQLVREVSPGGYAL